MTKCAANTKKGVPCKNNAVSGYSYCRLHQTIAYPTEEPAGQPRFSKSETHQFLKDEYLHIQKTMVDLDGRAVSIKAWTVSFSLAAMVGAFVKSTPEIFLVAALSAIVFLWIEVIWKKIQYAFYDRSSLLEKYFSGEDVQIEPFQIDKHWFASHKNIRLKEQLKIFTKQHVYLPHFPILVVSLLLYLITSTGILNLEPNKTPQPTANPPFRSGLSDG